MASSRLLEPSWSVPRGSSSLPRAFLEAPRGFLEPSSTIAIVPRGFLEESYSSSTFLELPRGLSVPRGLLEASSRAPGVPRAPRGFLDVSSRPKTSSRLPRGAFAFLEASSRLLEGGARSGTHPLVASSRQRGTRTGYRIVRFGGISVPNSSARTLAAGKGRCRRRM